MRTGFELLRITIRPRKEYIITYTKTTTQLLPSPYATNCINYTSIRFKSRQDCIDKCKIEIVMKKCSGWPEDVNSPANDNITIRGRNTLGETKWLKCMNGTDINKVCSRKCHQ